MFTGIVEEIGTVVLFARKSHGAKISVALRKQFSDIKNGDSIAVNGVCLTICEISRNGFSADVSLETLKSSNLSELKIGQKVNVERAMMLSSRVGGHIITGHVDCVIELISKTSHGQAYEFVFSAPNVIKRYIVPKGSVSIDGVSLTVARLLRDGFSVMVVPYTARYTTLEQKQIGDKLNIEADVLSKYIEGLLSGEAQSQTEKMFMDAGILPIGIIDN